MEEVKDHGKEESKLDLSDQLDSILKQHEENSSPKRRESPTSRLRSISPTRLTAAASKSHDEPLSRVPSTSSVPKTKGKFKGVAAVVKLGVKASQGTLKSSKQELTDEQKRILEALEVGRGLFQRFCVPFEPITVKPLRGRNQTSDLYFGAAWDPEAPDRKTQPSVAQETLRKTSCVGLPELHLLMRSIGLEGDVTHKVMSKAITAAKEASGSDKNTNETLLFENEFPYWFGAIADLVGLPQGSLVDYTKATQLKAYTDKQKERLEKGNHLKHVVRGVLAGRRLVQLFQSDGAGAARKSSRSPKPEVQQPKSLSEKLKMRMHAKMREREASRQMRPAPYPTSYAGPFTMRWNHPPPRGTIFQAPDSYSDFSKFLRDQGRAPSPQVSPLQAYLPPKPSGEDGLDTYYMPRGIGKVMCTVCSRIFLNDFMLQQHLKSKDHRNKLFEMHHSKSEVELAAIHLPSLQDPKPMKAQGERYLGESDDPSSPAPPQDHYSKSTKNLLGITTQEMIDEAEEMNHDTILGRRNDRAVRRRSLMMQATDAMVTANELAHLFAPNSILGEKQPHVDTPPRRPSSMENEASPSGKPKRSVKLQRTPKTKFITGASDDAADDHPPAVSGAERTPSSKSDDKQETTSPARTPGSDGKNKPRLKRSGGMTPKSPIHLFSEEEDHKAGYDVNARLPSPKVTADGTRATKADVQIALSTNTDFWWEKLRVHLEHRDVSDGDDGLGHLQRAKIFKTMPHSIWNLDTKSFKRPVKQNDVIIKLDAEVLDALRQYLLLCVGIRTAPSSIFLSNPASPVLNVKARLVPRVKSIQSLAAAVATTTWLTELDFSSNDLKSSGTTALCTALCLSANQIEKLNLDDNDINGIMKDFKDEVIPMEEDAEVSDPFVMPFALLQPWPNPSTYGSPSNRIINETAAAESICRLIDEKPLKHLSLAHNQLGNDAIALIAEAVAESYHLVFLSLADNNAQKTLLDTAATSLGNMVATNYFLTHLDLRWNCIGGVGAEAFATALQQNSSLERLQLGWNCFGRRNAMTAMRDALTCSNLQYIDLSYNGITEKTAFVLGTGLGNARHLNYVNLDGNMINQVGAREIQDALLRVDDDPVTISMKDCGVNSKMARDFDPAEPAGTYALDLAEEYSKKVLMNLVRVAMQGDGQFEAGSITLNGKPFRISLVSIQESMMTRAKPPGTGSPMNSAARRVSTAAQKFKGLNKRGSQTQLKNIRENNQSPPQIQTEAMRKVQEFMSSDGDNRFTSQIQQMAIHESPPNTAPMEEREGSSVGTGRDLSLPSTSHGTDSKPPTAGGKLSRQTSNLKDALKEFKAGSPLALSAPPSRRGKTGSAQVLPETGILEFKFSSTLKPPEEGTELGSGKMLSARAVVSDQTLTKHFLFSQLGSVLKGLVLSTRQAIDLFQLIPEFDTDKRVAMVECVFNKISDPGNSYQLLQLLRESEYDQILQNLGFTAFNFTTNNPTGHHVLNLGKETERQVAVRLVALKNRELAYEEAAIKSAVARGGRLGGDMVRFDRVWRNVKMDRKPFQFSSSWAVPREGILELDFTQISKPEADVEAISGELLHQRIDSEWDDKASGLQLVSIVRQLSNEYYFTCRQVQKLLQMLTQAAYLLVSKEANPNKPQETSALKRWRNRFIAQAFATWTLWLKSRGQIAVLSREGVDELKRLQVELVVTCFARIIDWHGMRPLIVDTLKRDQRMMLETRLGAFNLFDPEVAVGLYDLDLENREHRRIAQELLQLGAEEPGRNFVDVTYNDKDFVIPNGWLTNLPSKGHLSIHYCREDATAREVVARNRESPSWPEGYMERTGQAWVLYMRLRVVKEKLMERFESAKQSFQAMDRDGQGSLDRTEIAVHLFSYGVWLAPKEISAMMRVLDEDGSGEIDFDEWAAFWHSEIDLDSGKLINEQDAH